MAVEASLVDGIGIDDNTASAPNPGVMSGKKFKILGQTVNKATGNIANQQCGTVDLPVLAAGATGTVVVSNSLVTTASMIIPGVVNEVAAGTFAGDVTSTRNVTVWIESVGNGTFTLGYHSGAAMSTDWSCWYLIIN